MSVLQLVSRVCPVCDKPEFRTVDSESWEAYCAGASVQMAFGHLSPMDREFIVSGVCSDACWDDLYGGLDLPEDGGTEG